MLEKYGMWGEKNMYGNVTMGVKRSTAVIDKTGKLVKFFSNVKAEGHAEKVLEFCQEVFGKSSGA